MREEDIHTLVDHLAPQIACANVVVRDKMFVRDGEKLAAVRGVVKSLDPEAGLTCWRVHFRKALGIGGSMSRRRASIGGAGNSI